MPVGYCSRREYYGGVGMVRKWTPDEVRLLCRYYCETSMTAPEIGEVLGRSAGAVSAKLGTLALNTHRNVSAQVQ